MFDSEIPSAAATGINGDGSLQLGSDDKMIVTFYKRAVQDEYQSKTTGKPHFVERDYIKIIQPGEKDIYDAPVKEQHKMRFPVKWQAYLQRKEQAADGTPLDLLFPDNPVIVATLRACHIQTVQQLANLSDTAAGNLQFGSELRKKAQMYLEGAEKGKKFHTLERRIQDQDAQIKELKEQIAVLMAAKEKAA